MSTISMSHQEKVQDFLAQKRIAVSGLSRTQDSGAGAIYLKLRDHGYQVFPLHPEAWTPPASEQRALQAIVRHLADLKAMRQQESNRLTSGVAAEPVVHALQQHMPFCLSRLPTWNAKSTTISTSFLI